ncbi:Hypothetical protein PENO1_108860 [Penicillium occitanis (nom. inval.)]|nr:Hypothetical protein PENO1_108860 [Penicillium occitanis (nom. inval.)]PCG88994.1 hypothetical protein PENOC_108520 [Penicillium occitanis (nom. inval.)]
MEPPHSSKSRKIDLGFHPFVGWEEDREYDEQPPRYIRYTIEWRLMLNHKKAGSMTRKDLIIAPSDFWQNRLKANLDDMLQAKRKRNQRVRSTDIDWAPVERQLSKWSNLLHIGKRLNVAIVFNFGQDLNGDEPLSTKRGEKRGRMTATNIMLAERDAWIGAEEERTGRPSTWNFVYELMQCNSRSCQLSSDWCWEDPRDHRHYKLRQPHLERLIDFVDKEDGKLESHDDVPQDIRRDLILESQAGRKSKKAGALTTGLHPVNINVLPAQPANASTESVHGPP